MFLDELELHSSRGIVTEAHHMLVRIYVLCLLVGPTQLC